MHSILEDEEIELIAIAFTTYKTTLKLCSPCSKIDKQFANYEIPRTDEIAKKLGIIKDHYYTYE